ncbi:MAG: HDOD domain-containing protein [Desulfobacteraceae bacterium]|nr:HDOD domain-containing protein [Desulfobacteraceae bacterium]
MTTPMHHSATAYEPIFVARQPIFDRNEQICGYELLFRHSATATTACIFDSTVATSQMIADCFSIASSGFRKGNRAFINFTQDLLLKGAPLALPKDGCIIEILETVQPIPQVVEACRKYKEAGYRLALDDFVGEPGFEPFLEIADIIKVDMAQLKPPEIIRIAQRLERHQCELLAEKIENHQIYDLARSLGFRYFQGYYFSRPQVMSGRKISIEKIAKFKLLQELSKEDYKISELANIICTDVSLSYRLLTFLNSPAFALRQKIQSVPQAIVIMGEVPLKQWLNAVILADLDSSQRAWEIIFTSIRRGRFLELTASRTTCWPHQPGSIFLLGLFSEIDALLGMNMHEIIKSIPLSHELNAALCGNNNAAHRWLTLARTIDNGDWPQVGNILSELHLQAEWVAKHHQEATAWARNLLDSTNSQ